MTRTKLLALAPLALAGACHTGDLDPMEQQPKLKEYSATRHFDNEMSMRQFVGGTVPRERDLSGPPLVNAALLDLGHEKFNQMCTPCHGMIGDGKGSVAQKFSLRQPPSLHDARRRALASEYIYRVVSEGFGLMPRFTTQLDAHERWAVVAYVRALQHSQDVQYADLSPEMRDELDHPKPKPAKEEKRDEETPAGMQNEPVEVKHNGRALEDEGIATPGAKKGDESGVLPPPTREEAR